MKNIKIAFFDAKPYDNTSFNKVNRNRGIEFKFFNNRLSVDNAILAKGFNVVCVFVNDTIDKDVIDALVEYKVDMIALRCAGYNNIDIQYAYDKIHVLRVPAYSPYAVAEHAAALILSLNRKIHKAYYRTRDSNFRITGLEGFDLHGKTAGIIGAGKIGKVMINILKGFGMRILAFDNFKDDHYAKEIGFEYTSLDTIYEESDIISLHCPLTKESRHMINSESINRMKDGVMLINTSRGHLVDTKSLIKGLKSGKIGSAGLDVYEEEADYFFEDFSGSMITDDMLARLLTFNNVIVTSHQAFLTEEALGNIATTTLKNIDDYFSGEYLENEICYKCDKKGCRKDRRERCF